MVNVEKMEEDIKNRLKSLEEKSIYNFSEIERRLIELENSKSEVIGDRLQHVEDLLLLMQVEGEKIKDILSSRLLDSTGGGRTEERIERLEKALEDRGLQNVGSSESSGNSDGMQKRFDDIERVITEQVTEIDKRLIRIEDHIFHNKKDINIESKPTGTLKEVQSIIDDDESVCVDETPEEPEEAPKDVGAPKKEKEKKGHGFRLRKKKTLRI
ncbi:hypothetical protein ACFLQN_02355 [Candidatus Aenigmatarchaeota archaeon]